MISSLLQASAYSFKLNRQVSTAFFLQKYCYGSLISQGQESNILSECAVQIMQLEINFMVVTLQDLLFNYLF